MNYSLRLFALVMPLVLLALVGCSKPTTDSLKHLKGTPEPVAASDPFRLFLDTVRYPENPRPSDDWTRFREGIHHLGGYFARTDVMASLTLDPVDRKFLETDARLTEDELAEVETTTFRTADAHHLDECFLLRDAARSLEVTGLDPAQQAQSHFRWVMRNVYLYEQGDAWVPPAFVLRRGFGSALERALVFLALLRQSHIEGCLIVVPEPEPKHLLVAALDPKAGQMYLFDPRLAMAIRSKDRSKIATLKDVQEDPRLLQPSMIAADDVKKLEAWLACPLYALSPRMSVLEKGLRNHQSITLHVKPTRLREDIATASKLPVKVWNGPATDGKLPNSPTRSLRMFLPRQDGGLDETNRAAKVADDRLPIYQTRLNFAQINLRLPVTPDIAYEKVLDKTKDLFDKYDTQLREMFLRARYEAVLRRQDRLQTFTRNHALTGLAEDVGFQKAFKVWHSQLVDAHAAVKLLEGNPRAKAQAVKTFESLLDQDQFVERWLLDLESEKPLERDQFVSWVTDRDNEKKLVRDYRKFLIAGILAIGVGEYFDGELARSQGSINTEKAERAQAQWQAMATPTKFAKTKADEAWSMAKTSWSTFYLERIPPLSQTIEQRLRQLQNRVPPGNLMMRLGLLEQLHREVHQSFEAKWRLAECLERLEGKKNVAASWQRILTEIEDLERKALLVAEINKQRDGLTQFRLGEKDRAGLQARFDALSRDWSEGGSYFWMKQHLREKLKPGAP